MRDGRVADCTECGRPYPHIDTNNPDFAQTLVLTSAKTAMAPRPQGEREDLVGKTLDHFEVLDELGSGGMGTVYRALDRSLERFVALKVLNGSEAIKQKRIIQAFTHEARAQARINHPGVATIYYVGHHGEMTYLAMELVPGISLEARIQQGALTFGEVISVGLQVVRALREANARGVVHRDIKPGNIMLTQNGRVTVTDFGLSKTEKGGLEITGSHSITGTPYYIAPEQARGSTTDFRADIYSLGATLYHLAFRKPPFDGSNFVEVIAKHLSDPLEFPPTFPDDVPEGFRFLIERMMAKEPRHRFKNYEKLERAVLELRPESLRVVRLPRRAIATVLDFGAALLPTGVALILALVVARQLSDVDARIAGVVCSVALAFGLVYQCFQGTTAGKVFAKIRIARIDGRRLSRGRLLARGVAQFLPLLLLCGFFLRTGGDVAWPQVASFVMSLFLIDHLWCLTNRNRRTLHDYMVKTWVVDDIAAEVEVEHW